MDNKVKSQVQQKAIRQAQEVYGDAAISAIGTDNFYRLEFYGRMLHKAERLKPIPLPPMYWVLYHPDGSKQSGWL